MQLAFQINNVDTVVAHKTNAASAQSINALTGLWYKYQTFRITQGINLFKLFQISKHSHQISHVRSTRPSYPSCGSWESWPCIYIDVLWNSLLTLLLAERGHCEHREGGSGERARHGEYKAFIPGIAELRDSVVHVSVLWGGQGGWHTRFLCRRKL